MIRNFQRLHILWSKAINRKSKLLNLDIGSGSTISLFSNFICTDIYNFNLLNKQRWFRP